MEKKARVFGFQVVIFPEDGGYSALAPEVNVASQGDTLDEAMSNIKEALELRMESLSPKELSEIKSRLGKKVLATQINVQILA